MDLDAEAAPSAEPAATRRLERAPPSASGAPRDTSSPRRGPLVFTLVALALFITWIGLRWRPGAESRETGPTRLEASQVPAAEAAGGSLTEPLKNASASPADVAPAPSPEHPSASGPAAAAAPSAPSVAPAAPGDSSAGLRAGPTTKPKPGASAAEPAPGRSTLSLTSAPPARVTVGGRRFASTPVLGLELPPGKYPVVFQSLGVLDDRVSATITLAPGESRGVHADFTSASPRVILR